MSNDSLQPTCAKIPVRPPWILAAAAAIGIGLQTAIGWSYTTDPQAEQWLTWIGYFLMGLGALLIVTSDRYFSRHGTNTDCARPDTALVKTGPYRFSRNPIYLSFAVIFIGLSLKANAPTLAVVALLMLAALDRLVVLPQERHLETVFGSHYQAYARRVRRWI